MMEIYTVQQGDTLWRIANRLDADLAQLFLANGLTASSPLVPGQALAVPDRFFQYIVQEGDQLGTIASRLGVPAQALINANQLRNPASLFPGQVLFIPYRNHTVTQGETLYGIARTYGADMGAIIQANRLPGTALSAGQVLRVPAPGRPVKEVNAYTTGFGAAGTAEVYQLGPYFTYLSPFRYTFREDGSLTPLNDRSVLQAAEANGVLPLLILANFTSEGFSSDLAARLLRNETLQETLISNLLATMRQKGYRGINFDFEYVYPEDRDRYTAFLRRVVRRFRPEGLLVSTALAPKISGTQPGLLYEAHDYGAHGAIVDFVILMTYEWGWAGGRPRAIAPIPEVRRVLDYAVTVIPRNKIMMGAPLYGRDWRIPWRAGTTARTISPQEAVSLAAQYGADIRYHPTDQAPYFRYTDASGQQHEVWFEDARSMRAKINLLNEYGLRGISYWVLGNPFPENWVVQQALIQARKR